MYVKNHLKKALWKIPVFILLFLLLLTLAPVQDYALASIEINSAPVNPKLIDFLNQAGEPSAEDCASGIIPSPIDLSHTRGFSVINNARMFGYAASYDLRTWGKVSSIKDQGVASSCWAHAACASLESFLLPGVWDFSENNMKNVLDINHPEGYDRAHNEGGNYIMAAAYLARWSGPVNETDDPYNAALSNSPGGLTTQKHVQEIHFLPERSSPTDNDNIKFYLSTYGALSAAYYDNGAYYNGANYAYYYDNTDSHNSNHAIAIVGWDDNFSSSKFTRTPAGNGAFLVKNSWGSGWGDSGYFWISYYDAKLSDFVAFNNSEASDNYEHIYQYDPLGWVSNLGAGANTLWGANVFTAGSNEYIEAVSFYTPQVNTEYLIRIYTGVSGSPVTGNLGTSQAGTILCPGYHSVALTSPVLVSSGTKFSVVVQMTTPGFNYPIPIEKPEAALKTTKATASNNQSFVSPDGVEWDDLTQVTNYANSNVCIKAFSTSLPPAPVLTADTSDNTVDNDLVITFTDNANWRGAITAVKADGILLASGNDYTVESGLLTLKPAGGKSVLQTPGDKTVTVEAALYDNATVTQTIKNGALNNMTVTQQPLPGLVSGGAFATQPIITLRDRYGNTVTVGDDASVTVIALPKTNDTWTLGGTTTKAAANGVVEFTDLTHTNGQVDAKITFTSGSVAAESAAMNLPAPAPALTADSTGNNVDNDIEITFTDDAAWRAAITTVKADGTALALSADYTIAPGVITLKPSGGKNVLQTTGNKVITIEATLYSLASVTQTILPGAATGIEITTQPAPGAVSGNAFQTQPQLRIYDQYSNTVSTGPGSTAEITATAFPGGSWIIGGTTAKAAVAGIVSYTDLTHTNGCENAKITFTCGAFTVDSAAMSLPFTAPPALSPDITANTVDNNLEITFTDDENWRAAITAVTLNGSPLVVTTDYEITAGKITLKPDGGNSLLTTAGANKTIAVQATGYNLASVAQTILNGVTTGIVVQQAPVPNTVGGGAFVQQPRIRLLDQFGNTVEAGAGSTAEVTAAPKAEDTWLLGGTTSINAVNGIAAFTDLVHISGQAGAALTFTCGLFTVNSGSIDLPLAAPPTLIADTDNNTVDVNLLISFTDNSDWRASITSLKLGGTTLNAATDYTITPGTITLIPSSNVLLQTPGNKSIVAEAAGYTPAAVTQPILNGALSGMFVTRQPVPGAASGDVFATQPEITLKDQYGNVVTTGSAASATVSAARQAENTWTLGGNASVNAVAGVATFADLNHTNGQAGAMITFSCNTLSVDSAAFNLPSPAPLLTADTSNNSVDNDLLITFADNGLWRAAITAVKIDGTALSAATDYTIAAGIITLKPSGGSNLLRTPGNKLVTVEATLFETATVTQTITNGAMASIAVTRQPVPGNDSGATFATQPQITILDQYANIVTTGDDASATVSAAPKAGQSWQLLGTLTVAANNGIATFTNLRHQDGQAGAIIAFTCSPCSVESAPVNLPAPAPVLTADSSANTVDNNLEITFADDEEWRTAITAVKADGTTLAAPADYTIAAGVLTLKPTVNNTLRFSGNRIISVEAAGYGPCQVTQVILNGALAGIAVTREPLPGTYSGNAFSTQPQITLRDQYGNTAANGPGSTAEVTAAPKAGDTWTIGGTATISAVNGVATFTDLTHTNSQSGAMITFSCASFTANSAPLNLPPPYSGSSGGGPVAPAQQQNISPLTNPTTEGDKAIDTSIKETGIAKIDFKNTSNTNTNISPTTVKDLADNNKTLNLENTGVNVALPPSVLSGISNTLKSTESVQFDVREISSSTKAELLAAAPLGESTGLFEIGGKIFDLTAQVVANGAAADIKGFSDPVAITIDLSGLNLTDEQLNQLTGTRLEKDSSGNVITVLLGGAYNPTNHTFTFYTDSFSLYTVLQKEYLTKINLTIGDRTALINNSVKVCDVAPTIINDRTMVPLRFIGETLGADFDWNEKTRSVTMCIGDKNLLLVIDKPRPDLDTPPTIIEGRTMVPLRYISESFGAKVMWFPTTRSVSVIM